MDGFKMILRVAVALLKLAKGKKIFSQDKHKM